MAFTFCETCRNSGVARDMGDDGPLAQPCGDCDRGARFTEATLPPDPHLAPRRDARPVPAFPHAEDTDPWAM